MNESCCSSEHTTKKPDLRIFIVCFILVFGTGFCNIDLFTDVEWRSKWFWLYLAVAVCGLLSLFVGMKPVGSKGGFRIGRSDGLIILLFLYCLFRAAAGEFMESFLPFCIVFLLVYHLSGRVIHNEAFASLSAAVAAVALLLALYGIAQQMGLLPSGSSFRVLGSFDNPAGYASMLALSLPFVGYFTLSDSGRMRYAAWITCMTLFTAILLSGSRTGILTAVAVGLLSVVKRYKTFFTGAVTWKKIAWTGVAVFIAAGLYFVKKDSADGRLLIWKCTWEMIQKKLLFGHGYQSFEAEYMLYQARYFEQNPESEFVLLADNVKHPFNELLLLIAEFGLVALFLFVLCVVGWIRIYLKNPKEESFVLLSVLLAGSIFSCFSYPFAYPFTWLIVGFSVGSLAALSCRNNQSSRKGWISVFLISLSSVILLGFTARQMYYEHKWHNVVHQARLGRIPGFISAYESLYPFFKNNAYFLYNYAAQLNYVGDIDRSIEVTVACEKMLNDYDIQLLKADNYKKQQDLYQARDCYVLASRMCPGRFMPIYELVGIYDRINQPDMALTLATEIVEKPVKIPSVLISAIKKRMKQRAIASEGS